MKIIDFLIAFVLFIISLILSTFTWVWESLKLFNHTWLKEFQSFSKTTKAIWDRE